MLECCFLSNIGLFFSFFNNTKTRSGSLKSELVDRFVHKGLGVVGAALLLGLEARAVVSISGNHRTGIQFLKLLFHLCDFLGPANRDRLRS